MKRTALIILTLVTAASALADDDGVPRRRTHSTTPTGLSIMANAGTIWADANTANFYSGRPSNANTINRVLYSNSYGTQIWQNLKTAGLISNAIGSYNELKVVEYPEMYYRTSYLIGMGIRYDYPSGFGWLLRFDLARLRATGAFNLSSTNGTGILSGNGQYIRCGMMGQEDRIHIDLALSRTVMLDDNLSLELDLGAQINNTKVKENMMEIGGDTYSILDIWNGQSPNVGTGSYDYINQGGIGWAVFMSALVGYHMDGLGAIKLAYTCYHSKTELKGYSAMGWTHSLSLRFELNNFSFLNK